MPPKRSKSRIFYRRSNVEKNGGASLKPSPEESKDLKRDYRKTIALFQCVKNSKHTWKSAHAWKEGRNELNCEECGEKAKVVDAKDEMCNLATFVCTCNAWWETLADMGLEQQVEKCEFCSLEVIGGVQQRMATHFWYKCSKAECGIEWEDAYIGEKFSQRCRQCFSAGIMIGMRKETEIEQVTRNMRQMSFVPQTGGTHDIEGCDMCQKFIRLGKKSCRQFKRVEMDYVIDAAGNISSEITWMSKEN